MESLVPSFRTLIAVGLALLLVMLRLEASRFNAAEYDDPIEALVCAATEMVGSPTPPQNSPSGMTTVQLWRTR